LAPQPRIVGLFAEAKPKDPSQKGGFRDDVFIPLRAIIRKPELYCDKEKFPMFFDHSPSTCALKKGDQVIKRATDKEGDYGVGFKRYVAAVSVFTMYRVHGSLLLLGSSPLRAF
jgi:hypothetical protein